VILVAVGELGTAARGGAIDGSICDANVVDGGEHLFRGLIDEDGGLEALVSKGSFRGSVGGFCFPG
jgi:hypothetical protein